MHCREQIWGREKKKATNSTLLVVEQTEQHLKLMHTNMNTDQDVGWIKLTIIHELNNG